MFLGWLAGRFGLNCPLRQYFSLYGAISQREGERKSVYIGPSPREREKEKK